VLHLSESEEGLWDRFVAGVAESDRSAVLPRWRRAKDLGAKHDGRAHPVGVRGHELATLRDAAFGHLADARGVLQTLEAQAAQRGLLAILADATGVIVRARGGDAFGAEVKRTRLVEGVRWDESTRGTNAIGTALAEQRAVAVVGRAHYEAVNHGLFCYAAPIVDPFGRQLGALDVTGPLDRDDGSLSLAVESATAAVAEVLRARAYAASEAGSLRLVERMIERCAAPVVLVEAPGTLRAHNEAARVELGITTGLACERLFGVGFVELARMALAGSAAFETPRRRFGVDFEPVLSNGDVLALACYFTPARTHAPRPALHRSAEPTPRAFDRIFARDPALLEAKRIAAKLAPSDVPVLLLAETGTGKELMAHAIHGASKRAEGPFVAINCGALADGVLESELFGHAPGAFTGASQRGAEGKLAAAHRGTLFLDEIGEMSPSAQATLLRFLEDGSYSRVGEATSRTADVRIVCATCRDLPELVRMGRFRQDLLYRIHGGCLRLPALRDRSDRLALAESVLESLAPERKLGPSAEAWVLDHDWPGNVRELKSALAYALAMQDEGDLDATSFPEPILLGPASKPPQPAGERPTPRRAVLRRMADDAMKRAGGNVSEAARLLGVARSTLYRMLGK
jgi:transcriptional regulator of acetoin/glycerol metabolism